MFLGVAEMGFSGGLVFLGVGFVYLFGSLLLGLFAPYIRRHMEKSQVSDLFDLLEIVYPSSHFVSIRKAFAFASLLVFFVMLAAQFVGIAVFYSYFSKTQLNSHSIIIASSIGMVTTIVYSAFGGLKKDILTDVVQFIFIVIGVSCIYVFNLNEVSIIETLKAMPSNDYSLKGKYNIVYLIGVLLFVAQSFFNRYDIWQRIITAKSDNVARFSFIVSGILAVIFFCLFGFLGIYAKGIKIDNAQFSALEVESVIQN